MLDVLGPRAWGVPGACCVAVLLKVPGRGIPGLAGTTPGPPARAPRRNGAGEGPAEDVGVHGDADPMPTAPAPVPDTTALLGV